ncbi:MAG: exodeoxyribonuclease VII large subunit, partial [Pseudomonadota bacterium]
PALLARVQAARLALTHRTARLMPRLLVEQRRRGAETLAGLARRLDPAARRGLAALADRLAAQGRLLASLGTDQTLARGFAIVRDGEDRVAMRAAALAPGTPMSVQFLDGRVGAVTAGTAESPAADLPRRPSPPSRRRGGAKGHGTPASAAQASLFDDG